MLKILLLKIYVVYPLIDFVNFIIRSLILPIYIYIYIYIHIC